MTFTIAWTLALCHNVLLCPRGHLPEEETILHVGAGADIAPPIVNRDGTRWVVVAGDANTHWLIIDGQIIDRAPHIRLVRWAGEHVLYVRRLEGLEEAVLGEQVLARGRTVSCVTSPGGDSVAVVVTDERRSKVVFDEIPGAWHDAIMTVLVAPGGRVAYEAFRRVTPTSGPDGNIPPFAVRGRVVIDGQAGPEWDFVSNITFSADGTSVAYKATSGDLRSIVLNGQVGPFWKDCFNLRFHPEDADLFFYEAHTERGEGIVVNGVMTREMRRIKGRPIWLRGRANIAAYEAIDCEGRSVVVVGNRAWNNARELQVSRDGARYAFVVTEGKRERLVVDGAPGPAYDLIDTHVFSDDSRHIGYIAKRDAFYCVNIDGVEHRDNLDMVQMFRLHSHGYTCVVVKNGQFGVVTSAGQSTGWKWTDQVRLSSCGKHFAFCEGSIEGSARVVAGNGDIYGPFRDIHVDVLGVMRQGGPVFKLRGRAGEQVWVGKSTGRWFNQVRILNIDEKEVRYLGVLDGTIILVRKAL